VLRCTYCEASHFTLQRLGKKTMKRKKNIKVTDKPNITALTNAHL
jgi:hypothetical protein